MDFKIDENLPIEAKEPRQETDPEFKAAVHKVLVKNNELYRRLA